MESRVEKAVALHEQGYNCAQAVICTYCDLFGLDPESAYRMSEGVGLGMGLMDVCGALSGAFMIAGLKNSGGMNQPGKTKGSTYKLNKALAKAFEEKNGSIYCKELKGTETGKVLRSCAGCIEDACMFIESQLLADQEG